MLSQNKSRHSLEYIFLALLCLCGIVFFAPVPGLAQPVDTAIYDLTSKNPLPSLSFSRLFCTAANWLITLSIIVVVIVIGIAGIRFLTSQGDEARRRSAKNALLAAIAGLLVLLFAKGIIIVILNFLGTRITSMTC